MDAAAPQRMLTLTFHGLGTPTRELPPGEEEYWVAPKMFADVLDLVKGRPGVQVTFDDSNESDYTIALPLLKERNMTARFFVVAGRIGQKGSLSAEQVRLLHEEGMAVENHGMLHRRWHELGDADLQAELIEARDQIQQAAGAPVTEAACPFGSYNRRAMRMLREQGYRTVYTSDGGRASKDCWLHPRNTIVRSHDIGHVTRMLDSDGDAARELWRDVKMTIKRLR